MVGLLFLLSDAVLSSFVRSTYLRSNDILGVLVTLKIEISTQLIVLRPIRTETPSARLDKEIRPRHRGRRDR